MKILHIHLIFVALTAFLISCKNDKEKATYSCFTYYPSEEIKVGREVYFNSCSENEEITFWDFGDGEFSYAKHPNHIYRRVGDFEVKQIVQNETSSDTSTSILSVSRDGYIEYGSWKHEITQGFKYFSYYDTNNTKPCNKILLFDSGFNVGDNLSELNGEGDFAIIEIDSLLTGIFSHILSSDGESSDNYNSGKFSCKIAFNAQIPSVDEIFYTPTREGLLRVTKIGDRYEVVAECYDISIYFCGELIEIDYSF